VSLFFLSIGISYESPVDDPFFESHENITGSAHGMTETIYNSDLWVNSMGCADQFQVCNSNTFDSNGSPTNCTPLGGAFDVIFNRDNLHLNDLQSAFVDLVLNTTANSAIDGPVINRGSAALLASDYVTADRSSVGLPPNQWQLEVRHWFNMRLATLQQAVVQYASGPTGLSPLATTNGPQSPAESALCNAVRVRNVNGHTNFSSLGLGLILGLGGAIILIGLLIKPVTSMIFSRGSSNAKYRRLQWITDNDLQLQRLAYENAGWGGEWSGGTKTVPTTEDGQELGMIDASDENHPVLVRSSAPAVQSVSMPGHETMPENKENENGDANGDAHGGTEGGLNENANGNATGHGHMDMSTDGNQDGSFAHDVQPAVPQPEDSSDSH
jgi:hypothetical protein